jgi:hypothetical protein
MFGHRLRQLSLFAAMVLVMAILLAGCSSGAPVAEPEVSEAGQSAPAGSLSVQWQDGGDCRQATVDRNDNVRYGSCGGNLTTLQLGAAAEDAGAELAQFVDTFAPFSAETAAGVVDFGGQGEQVASAAEQRMLGEWARWLAREAEAGAATISDGVVFTWHRVGGSKAACDIVSLYVTGVVETRSCHSDPPRLLSRDRLTAAQLAELYGWADSLATFDEAQVSLDADGATVRLAFFGLGSDTANQPQQQAMIELAQSLFPATGSTDSQ